LKVSGKKKSGFRFFFTLAKTLRFEVPTTQNRTLHSKFFKKIQNVIFFQDKKKYEDPMYFS